MERSFKCKFMLCLAFCGRRIEFPFVIAAPQRILLHIVIILSLCDSRAAASYIGLDLVTIYLFFPSSLTRSLFLSVGFFRFNLILSCICTATSRVVFLPGLLIKYVACEWNDWSTGWLCVLEQSITTLLKRTYKSFIYANIVFGTTYIHMHKFNRWCCYCRNRRRCRLRRRHRRRHYSTMKAIILSLNSLPLSSVSFTTKS